MPSDFYPLPAQAYAKLQKLRSAAEEATRRAWYFLEAAANVLEVPEGYVYDPERRGFKRPAGAGPEPPDGGGGPPSLAGNPGDGAHEDDDGAPGDAGGGREDAS